MIAAIGRAWLTAGGATALLAISAASAQEPPQQALRSYDIPAQRLSGALAAFSKASGVDVLLDEPEAAGRQSARIAGRYAAPQALTLLLEGTGLVARFTSARSAVILPRTRAEARAPGEGPDTGPVLALDMLHVTAPRLIGGARGDVPPAFLLAVAGEIRTLVVAAGLLDGVRRQRTRIRARIDPDGRLRDVQVAEPSDVPTRDAAIAALLERRQLSVAPPPGLRRALLFDVSAQ